MQFLEYSKHFIKGYKYNIGNYFIMVFFKFFIVLYNHFLRAALFI